jgi:hypothetical protein
VHDIEPLLLALMVAVAGLSILARLVGVPYPILLVLDAPHRARARPRGHPAGDLTTEVAACA